MADPLALLSGSHHAMQAAHPIVVIIGIMDDGTDRTDMWAL
jgi:hypothetical protein